MLRKDVGNRVWNTLAYTSQKKVQKHGRTVTFQDTRCYMYHKLRKTTRHETGTLTENKNKL